MRLTLGRDHYKTCRGTGFVHKNIHTKENNFLKNSCLQSNPKLLYSLTGLQIIIHGKQSRRENLHHPPLPPPSPPPLNNLSNAMVRPVGFELQDLLSMSHLKIIKSLLYFCGKLSFIFLLTFYDQFPFCF